MAQQHQPLLAARSTCLLSHLATARVENTKCTQRKPTEQGETCVSNFLGAETCRFEDSGPLASGKSHKGHHRGLCCPKGQRSPALSLSTRNGSASLCIISWKPGKILLKERHIWHSDSSNHKHGYYQDIELFTLLVYNRNRFLIIQVTPTSSCVGHYKTFLAVSLCPLLPTSCFYRSFRTRQPEGSNIQMHTYLGEFPVVSGCMHNENPTRDHNLQGHMTGQLLWLQLDDSSPCLRHCSQPDISPQIHLILSHLHITSIQQINNPTAPATQIIHSTNHHCSNSKVPEKYELVKIRFSVSVSLRGEGVLTRQHQYFCLFSSKYFFMEKWLLWFIQRCLLDLVSVA